MKLFQRRGYWYVEFRDGTGRRVRHATGVAATEPEKVAERAAMDRMQRYLVTTAATPVAAIRVGAVYNLAEALERMLLTKWQSSVARGNKSLQYRVRRMEQEIGHWLIKEIDYNRLSKYVQDTLASGKRPATVNRRLSAIKTTLRECARKGELSVLPQFPEVLAEENIRERYVTPEEQAKIEQYLDRQCAIEELAQPERHEWRYLRSLFAVLVETGLRLSEALTLPECDGRVIHLKHGTTKASKTRKRGGGGRVVPLTPKAAAATTALLASPLHRAITHSQIQHYWKRVRLECGPADVNLHILRHTCATRLLEAGADLYTVQRWLGHSSQTVTERYAHLQTAALERAAALLAERSRT